MKLRKNRFYSVPIWFERLLMGAKHKLAELLKPTSRPISQAIFCMSARRGRKRKMENIYIKRTSCIVEWTTLTFHLLGNRQSICRKQLPAYFWKLHRFGKNDCKIREEDAKAEGVELCSPFELKQMPISLVTCLSNGAKVLKKTFRVGFYKTWQEINGKNRDAHWNRNPSVWVIEFRKKENRQ